MVGLAEALQRMQALPERLLVVAPRRRCIRVDREFVAVGNQAIATRRRQLARDPWFGAQIHYQVGVNALVIVLARLTEVEREGPEMTFDAQRTTGDRGRRNAGVSERPRNRRCADRDSCR